MSRPSPSGTAITLAEGIIESLSSKKQWVNFAPIFDVSAYDEKPRHELTDEDLIIRSVREGATPGIHEVRYESEDDELILRHTIKTVVHSLWVPSLPPSSSVVSRVSIRWTTYCNRIPLP